MRALPLLLTALLLAAALPASDAHAGNGENLMPMLPADAVIVGALNMEALRGTPTWRHVNTIMEGIPEVQRARQAMQGEGLQFEQAVRTIAFGVTEVSNPQNPSFLMVMEGAFPQAATLTTLRADDTLREEEHNGAPIFVGSDGIAAVSVNDTTIVMGKRPLVEAALARIAAEETTRFNSALRTQVRHADKSGVLWFAGRVTSQMRSANRDLQGVSGIAGSMNLSSGLAMRLRVDAENEDVVTKMVSDFEQSRSRLAGSPELRALGLAEVVNGLAMTGEGTTATLNVTVAADRWNALIATIGALIESERR